MFILGVDIQKADTTLKPLKADTSDKSVHKPNGSIDIDLAAKLHIEKYRDIPKRPSFIVLSRYVPVFLTLTSHIN